MSTASQTLTKESVTVTAQEAQGEVKAPNPRGPARRMRLIGLTFVGVGLLAAYSLTLVWWVIDMSSRVSAVFPTSAGEPTMVTWTETLTGLEEGGPIIKAAGLVIISSVIGLFTAFSVANSLNKRNNGFSMYPLLGAVILIAVGAFQAQKLGSFMEQAAGLQHATPMYRVSGWIQQGPGFETLQLANTISYFIIAAAVFQAIKIHLSLPKREGETGVIGSINGLREKASEMLSPKSK